MALYYKVPDIEAEEFPTFEGIQVHKGDTNLDEGPCIKYDFSKHVLIELLDNVTPESKLWKELGLVSNKKVVHKRLLVDPHRKNCRRAIIVCKSSDDAIEIAGRLTQAKIMKRCICAIVIQKLLSDLRLFEKQISQYGDKGSQHQFVYVTDLNRPREPECLVRYLREKFSPFGTILSVLVSEGNDGNALPEGVIRYAHLSEAFAAELAYDQCAVAMERLSVQTHHNILLSQCDLKARLKEAILKHSKETLNGQLDEGTVPKIPSDSDINNYQKSDSDRRENSKISSETSKVALDTIAGNDGQAEIVPIPSVSAELADVLENPCEENLMNCSQVIGNGNYYSKQAATCVGLDLDNDNELEKKRCHPSVIDKTLSSRIMGWITDIPSADDLPRLNDSVEERRMSDTSQPNDDSYQKLNTSGIVSNSDSFVTCRNEGQDFNFTQPSPASTVRCDIDDSNEVTWLFTPSPEPNSADGNSREAIQLSLDYRNTSPISTSQKRKNSSILTQKLSLKSQRLDSSKFLEVSENETTVHLPSTSNNRQCSVVLKYMPELDKLAESYKSFKYPLPPEELVPTQDTFPKIVQEFQQSASSTISDSSTAALSSKSTRSLPVRRSSRLESNLDDRKSASVCGGKRERKVSTSSIAHRQENKLMDDKGESPLRSWLKKELKSSTNNRIDGSLESTKSILCASANKDVIISVGCSHMTCDFCYPDSTRLLLGIH